jgi:hypothetical protein
MEMVKLGLSLPQAQSLAEMSHNDPALYKIIGRLTGKTPAQAQQAINKGLSGMQGIVTGLSEQTLGKEFGAAVAAETGYNITGYGALSGGLRNMQSAAAASKIDIDTVTGGPTAEELKARAAEAPGRGPTVQDMAKGAEAQIAASLAEFTGVMSKVSTGSALKVTFDEATMEAMKSGMQTAVERRTEGETAKDNAVTRADSRRGLNRGR